MEPTPCLARGRPTFLPRGESSAATPSAKRKFNVMEIIAASRFTNCEPLKSSISPACGRVLHRLGLHCAYQVRGSWRFRGLRRCINGPLLISLIAKGLAECVETDNFAELRITEAGRALNW